jgi:hypothetical protein
MATLPAGAPSGSFTPPDEPVEPPLVEVLDLTKAQLVNASDSGSGDEAASNAHLGTRMFFAMFPQLPDAQLHDMLNAFKAFEPSANGHVRPAQVAATLRKLDLVSSKMMLRFIIEAVDADGDGEIDLGEFIALMCGTAKDPSPTAERAMEQAPEDGDRDAPSKEELQEADDRRKAMAYFYRGVATIAFNQMSGAPEVQRQQLLLVLETEPELRTQWELQRLLIWCVHTRQKRFTLDTHGSHLPRGSSSLLTWIYHCVYPQAGTGGVCCDRTAP